MAANSHPICLLAFTPAFAVELPENASPYVQQEYCEQIYILLQQAERLP